MSQPAASKRLRLLEQTLGLELLNRSHGRAQLTSAGNAVVRWGEDVLEAIQDLQLGTQALRADGKTHLRIVASMTVAEYLVPGWINRLRAVDAEISISLAMGNSQHVVETMLHDEADVGFIEGTHAPRLLNSKVVQSDNLVVIAAPTSKWASYKMPMSARELATTPLIMREAGSGTREVLETAMNSLGLSVTSLVELGSTTAIKGAVISGVGPGVLSRLAVEADVRDARLAIVEIDGVSLERTIRVVWSKESALSPAARLLLRQICDLPNDERSFALECLK
jgi:DNA-binding transcriptional LysR family regulator